MTSAYEILKAQFAESIFKALAPFKTRIEPAISASIERFGEKTALRDACEHALQTGGKRFRPAIVYMMADGLKSKVDVTDAALAVEFFHTASLIADDLPCMDNDDFRRGLPTTHKVFGEAVALLASFSLIAAGFECIATNSEKKGDVCQLALWHASRLNGIHALIGGQFIDLYPPELDRQKLYEIMEKKTVSLFELSFVLGWLFAGGDRQKLSDVQKAAFHFGSAFQIIDDLDDMKKDREANRKANFANLFGIPAAIDAVKMHTKAFRELLQELHIESEPLHLLAEGMSELAEAFEKVSLSS